MPMTPKRYFATFLGVFALCGLSGWLVWRFSEFGRAEADLEGRVAEARALGLPWLAEDMAQKPPVKDEENAAPLIRKAVAAGKEPDVAAGLNEVGEAYDYRDEAGEAAGLRKLGPWLAIVRKAADKPRCDFHRDWDEGYWLLLPEYAKLKTMARALASQAAVEAREGNVDLALADLRRAAQMGVFAKSDPCLIAMLVSIACDAIVLAAAERIAEAWHTDAGRLAKLRRTVEGIDVAADIAWALRGEVYMDVTFMRNFPGLRRYLSWGVISSSGDDIPRPKVLVRTGIPRDRPARVILSRQLEYWIWAYKDLVPKCDPAEIGRRLDDRAAKMEVTGWSRRLAARMLPVYANAGGSVTKTQATKAVTVGLAAVLEFRARKGRYPLSLAEAGVTVLDPYDGRPLKLAVKGESCRVYSVGPDKRDDGGVRESEALPGAGGAKKWDYSASYPAFRKPKRTPPAPGPGPAPKAPTPGVVSP